MSAAAGAVRREGLLALAEQAIAACHGEPLCLQAAAALPAAPTALLGAGKACCAMARGLLAGLARPPARGLLVAKDGHADGFAAAGVELRFAGHPEPDGRSAAAGRAAAALVRRLGEGERLVVLLSGGASALLAVPLPPLEAAHLAQATRAMLAAGLPIERINLVRRQLTSASGGRLAALCRAEVEVLLLGDVLSAAPSDIGSGPFAPARGGFAAALEIARQVPGIGARAVALLERGAASGVPAAPSPDDPCFGRVRHRLLASPERLVDAACGAAADRGLEVAARPPLSGAPVERVAARWAALATELGPGQLAVGGGEPTVVLPPSPGQGGRSQQLALLMAKALGGGRPACFAAICSDGGDGPTDAAGAVVDEQSWRRLSQHGDPEAALAHADAYRLLDAAGALVRTGPTGTNVLDLHLLWVG